MSKLMSDKEINAKLKLIDAMLIVIGVIIAINYQVLSATSLILAIKLIDMPLFFFITAIGYYALLSLIISNSGLHFEIPIAILSICTAVTFATSISMTLLLAISSILDFYIYMIILSLFLSVALIPNSWSNKPRGWIISHRKRR